MEITYDWMKATAVSKINNASWIKIKIEINRRDMEDPVFPNKVKIKWPAIMLADKRTAKVPGRIIFLIVSIQIIKGIRMEGVPEGTKCVNMWLVLLIHPKNIKVSHRGRDTESVRIKCLVLVKM